jgi:hypothetical protein
MLHHVSVGVSDVERAARFYDPARLPSKRTRKTPKKKNPRGVGEK